MAIWPRVQGVPGENVVSVVPLATPFSTAHNTAGSPDMEGEFPFADVPFGDGDGHGQPLYWYADQAVLCP